MPFFPDAFVDSHNRRSSSRQHTTKRRRSRSSSRDRGRDRDRDRDRDRGASSLLGDFFGKDSSYSKHNTSRSSFFGVPLGNSSRSSFFGFGSRSGPSYYKRSPRKGFMQRAYKQLRRLLRDLVHWFKRHPWKVFFMVLMPLVTGGALTGLLARFGLRIPAALERALGMASRAASGDSYGFVADAVRMAGGGGGGGGPAAGARSVHARRDSYSDFGHRGPQSGYGGGGGGGDWSDGIMGVAKMFI